MFRAGFLRRLKVGRVRGLQALAVALVAIVMMGADASEHRFDKLGHNLVCTCGCGQILLECNHVSCPDSPRLISELRQQVSLGSPDTTIMNFFAGKYGATVLAAPIRDGFDTVAWVMPLAVFFLATVGTATLIKVWHTRSTRGGTPEEPMRMPETAEAGALRARIRQETEF